MKYNNVNIVLKDKIIKKGSFEIIDNKIANVSEKANDGVDCQGMTVIPGFIDIHTHGGYGFDLMEKDNDKMIHYLNKLPSEGTTSVVQCTITDTWENTVAVTKWYGENKSKFLNQGAIHLGIHHEGIFMAKEKKGAHNETLFRELDPNKIIELNKASNNNIKIVTYAPELDKSLEFTKTLIKQNIVASMGHTNANYGDSIKAIKAGANSVTHLYNAMKGISHREPSILLAALTTKDLKVELITDGVHVCKEMVKFAYDLKGYKNIMCITDSLSMKGLADGEYKSGGFKVIKKGNSIKMENGTIAGGSGRMIECFKNIMNFTDCSLIQACHMCSTNQAELLKIDNEYGSIENNKIANLVFIDKEFNIVKTIVNGGVVYESN